MTRQTGWPYFHVLLNWVLRGPCVSRLLGEGSLQVFRWLVGWYSSCHTALAWRENIWTKPLLTDILYWHSIYCIVNMREFHATRLTFARPLTAPSIPQLTTKKSIRLKLWTNLTLRGWRSQLFNATDFVGDGETVAPHFCFDWSGWTLVLIQYKTNFLSKLGKARNP